MWNRITLKRADELISLAMMLTYCQLHNVIGVGDRNLRRAKQNARRFPQQSSPMGFLTYNLLLSLVYDMPVIKKEQDCQSMIEPYITDYSNFRCPPKDVLKSLIGKHGALKLSRSQVAARMNISSDTLSGAIEKESLSFPMWCAIMLMAGVDQKRFLTNYE